MLQPVPPGVEVIFLFLSLTLFLVQKLLLLLLSESLTIETLKLLIEFLELGLLKLLLNNGKSRVVTLNRNLFVVMRLLKVNLDIGFNTTDGIIRLAFYDI